MWSMDGLLSLFLAFRPTQWLKNLILYAAITFNGELFDSSLFVKVLYGVISFSLLSSASYLINDLKDLPYDKKHPIKKYRPLASGRVSRKIASTAIIVLVAGGFFMAHTLS